MMISRKKKSRGPGGPESLSALDALLFTGAPRAGPSPIKGPIVPRTEVKYVDVAAAVYDANTTGTITALNLIAQGVDNTQRVGREAVMLAMSLRGTVIPTSGTAIAPQVARMLVVWDNSSNGALPAILDVLTSTDIYGFPNVSNIGRFTILHDQMFAFGPLTAALADKTSYSVDVKLKLNSATRFAGTTAAIASMQDGTVLLITVGSVVAGAADASFVLSSRTSFLDQS